ncbi:MAG: InlB B-repeat-containing protein [Lachnospiraceae bacterium]|nr:InlB B-repeat-containing protein [Lachnospiraceae bacterium]
MKRKLSLIVVMLLSFSLFATNLAGLRIAVQAAEEEAGLEEALGVEAPAAEAPAPEPVSEQPAAPQPVAEAPASDDAAKQAEEEAKRQAEEAKRQAEEAARKQAEEEQRKAAEAEVQRQAEQAAAEEAKRQAEQAAKEEAARQAEAAKQAALEQAAKEAAEAEKKQLEADAAAAEAKRLAEEEAKRAQEAAEQAKKAEEEAKKKEDPSYALRIQEGGGNISNIPLSGSVGNGDYLNFTVANFGERDVNLVYGISGATANVFSLSLTDGSTDLKVGNSAKFRIELNSSAPVGSYSAKLYFKDASDSGNLYTRVVTVSANVKAKDSVSRVAIYPSRITLAQGGDCSFYAEVSGTGEVSQEVSWNVSGARSSGTYITSNGVLIVGGNETASSISVIATSRANTKVSDRATVTIQSGSYNVKAAADPQKGGIVTGGGAVTSGGSVTLSAVPSKNYYFEGWMRDGKKVSTSTNYTINDVRGNITVTAKFKQNYVTITAVSEDDRAGTVLGGGKISYGGKTTLSAKAKDGYVFTGWKEGDSIISNSASLELNNLTADRKITAKFARTSYSVSIAASPQTGGTVSGGGTFSLGSEVRISASPAQGYTFQSWNVNGQIVSRDLNYRIEKLNKDYSFTAVFIPTGVVTYSISAGVATTGGMINPSGITVVAAGQNVTYTITPKAGFAILAVAVDGAQVGPVTTYTFPNITANHSIAAAFVQTDAGARAAASTGAAPQTKKVQTVVKTETNTATEDKTVDLEDAATGTAGDEYVEEMDLSEIAIPTDEELGITEELNIDSYSGVLKSLGISLDEAKMMIANGQVDDIIRAAFYEGTLDVYVDNQYAPATEVPDYTTLSREELELLPDEDIYPSMPNLDIVTERLLGASDVLDLADGGEANITVSITKSDDYVDDVSKRIINSAVGQKPVQYFDLTLMKIVDGAPENIKELSEPMEVVIEIPNEIYKSGKTYSVLRAHDGTLTTLPDLDNDPKTITFRTDRFSAYAISEQIATAKDMAIRFAIGALITLIIALICLVILLYQQLKGRKRRRKRG